MADPRSAGPETARTSQPHGRGSLFLALVFLSLATVLVGFGVMVDLYGRSGREQAAPPHARSSHREGGIGVCLQVADSTADSTDIAATLYAAAQAQAHLFPAPAMATRESGSGALVIAIWPVAPAAGDLATMESSQAPGPCPRLSTGWGFAVTRAVLADGADRMLAKAEFSDAWTGTMTVTFHPAESMVRTTLDFAGPLGISGSCWLDETLSVDSASGRPIVEGTFDDDAGLAGLVACRRFQDTVSEGGAGAQALGLLTAALAEPGSTAPPLLADSIVMTEKTLVVQGTVGAG